MRWAFLGLFPVPLLASFVATPVAQGGDRPAKPGPDDPAPVAATVSPTPQDFSWWTAATPPPPFVGDLVEEGAQDQRLIWAGNARFTPGDPPQLPAELELPLVDASGRFVPGWFLVRFEGGVTESAKLLLDALTGPVTREDGSPVHRAYVPDDTLLAWIGSSATYGLVSEATDVSWIGRYQPGYKLDPTIGSVPLTSPDRVGRPTYLLDVELVPGHPAPDVVRDLGAAGAFVHDYVELRGARGYDVRFVVAEAAPALVTRLALIEGVRLIQERGDGLRLYDLSGGGKLQNRTLAADDGSASPIVTASTFPLWVTHNLQGQHQLIGVVDTALDWNNVGTTGCNFGFPDTAINNYGFANPVTASLLLPSIGTGGVSLKVPRADILGGAALQGTQNNEHGCGVAGAALADFYANNASKWWEHDVDNWESWAPSNFSGLLGNGVAPEAQLYFTPVMNGASFRWEFVGEFEANMGTTLTNMANAGVCSTNHSVGLAEANNTYTATSVVHDTKGYDHPTMLQCMAAGNDGAVASALASQACVKNALAVGASDDVLKPEDRVTFSSIGPRFDGATKPELMAPGNDTAPRQGGTQSLLILPDANGASTASCSYQWTAGTSFSSPIMAGAAALVHQYFEEGRYTGSTPITDASAALMKAMLINSGHRLTGLNLGNGQYPNNYQGWGEPNLSDVLDFGTGARRLAAYDVSSASGFTSSASAPHVRTITVNSSSERLRVTIAWTDEPGSAGTGKKLINDLDLLVQSPGGSIFRGNVFDGVAGTSITGGTADTLNNFENVIVASPALGTWTVTVDPGAGNYAAGQGYALVVTGGVSEGGGPAAPVANFSGTPTSGTAPLSVNFTDLSTGSVTGWSWSFGDSGTSTAQHPSHTYMSAGTYTVSLTATGPGGSDVETKTGYITVSAAPGAPVANFSGTPTSGTAPLNVSFTDLSSGSVTSWSWNFGDGGTSALQHPSHTYAAAGSYTVSLTATGPGGSDGETKVGYINVGGPPAGKIYYLSFNATTTVPGVGSVADEDVVTYDPSSGTFALYFDGSDVGLAGTDIDALHVLDDGDLVLSFDASFSVPGLVGGPSGTTVADADLVIFSFTTSGPTTSGSFSFVFDGSDVGLTTSNEDVDAIYEFPGGGLAVSTLGGGSVPGFGSFADEDLLFFSASQYGSATIGTWSWQFDGSDVGFTATAEDVDAVAFDDGIDMLFSTEGSWSAAGGSGADEDVGRFVGTFGSATSGTASLQLDLSAAGIPTSANVDGVAYR